MQKQEYDKMDRLENEMWWYTGLHSHLLFFLRHALAGRKDALVLDAGCGTGGFLEMAAKDLPGSWVVGLDAVECACLSARVKSGRAVCVGSVNAVPFAKNAFTAIVSADVLCHRSVDEAQALLSFNRCLVTGGTLVLNVPAYQWLYSAHDRAVCTVRRYTTTRLRQLLREAGFAENHYYLLEHIFIPTDGAPSDFDP